MKGAGRFINKTFRKQISGHFVNDKGASTYVTGVMFV